MHKVWPALDTSYEGLLNRWKSYCIVCKNIAVSCLFAYFLYHSLPRHPCCYIWDISWKLPSADNAGGKYTLGPHYDGRLIWLSTVVDFIMTCGFEEYNSSSSSLWTTEDINRRWYMKCQPELIMKRGKSTADDIWTAVDGGEEKRDVDGNGINRRW